MTFVHVHVCECALFNVNLILGGMEDLFSSFFGDNIFGGGGHPFGGGGRGGSRRPGRRRMKGEDTMHQHK